MSDQHHSMGSPFEAHPCGHAEALSAAALYNETRDQVQAAPVGSVERRLHSALGDLAHVVLATEGQPPSVPAVTPGGVADDGCHRPVPDDAAPVVTQIEEIR